MGKNLHGGAGHKKFARKHAPTGNQNKRLRAAEHPGEIYAIVTKMLGNGMFHCFCIDGVVRLGHIRGKFAGRGKRDNLVEAGKWLLIGLREWDLATTTVKTTKMQHCDLLEVYSDLDKQRLRDNGNENWRALEENDVSKTAIVGTEFKDTDEYGDGDIVFGTERDFEREKLIEEMKSSKVEKISLKIISADDIRRDLNLDEEEEEMVNVDDI